MVEVGRGVHTLRPGDQAIVSSVSACGHCPLCQDGMYGQCRGGGGWSWGIWSTEPRPSSCVCPSPTPPPTGGPPLALDDAVLLAELLPTAYEVGVHNGHVGPGDTVVVVGAGPVGLAARSPSRGSTRPAGSSRLTCLRPGWKPPPVSGRIPAEVPGRLIADLAEGPGADVVIEAAGDPDSFALCTRVVRPAGGHIANIGMHGKPATLHLEALWRKNITISTGQVDTSSMPWLLDLVTLGHLPISQLVTHTFSLDRMKDAYDVFSHGTDTGALKVVLHRE